MCISLPEKLNTGWMVFPPYPQSGNQASLPTFKPYLDINHNTHRQNAISSGRKMAAILGKHRVSGEAHNSLSSSQLLDALTEMHLAKWEGGGGRKMNPIEVNSNGTRNYILTYTIITYYKW